jgi:hypothetical protein
VKISVPRQKRILSSLAQGDLIWEVPDESYFTQYNEGAGSSRRLRMVELLEMQESGWIRRGREMYDLRVLEYDCQRCGK